MRWFANILHSAVGPISGGFRVEIQWPRWLTLVLCIPVGWLFGWLINKYGHPIASKISDRDILWLILFSIWWTRRVT